MKTDPARSSTQVYRFGTMAFRNFQSKSPKMAECLTLAERAAETDFAILITGESGTGKTLLAQAIHNASKRSQNPFVSINMSALSEGVLESELFGHEKGAFTGAGRLRIGHFEKASGGTLLLDEIADMSLSAQPKILHAVEYKQFQRVGGETLIHADVRILSCTHCDLETLVTSKRFRHDLLYRLQELVIRVPPLRERLEDLPALCGVLLGESERSAGLPPMRMAEEALRRMAVYGWPGNIRELKSVIRRAGMLAGGGVIRAEHLGLPTETVEVTRQDPRHDPPRPREGHVAAPGTATSYTHAAPPMPPHGSDPRATGLSAPTPPPSAQHGHGFGTAAPSTEMPQGIPPRDTTLDTVGTHAHMTMPFAFDGGAAEGESLRLADVEARHIAYVMGVAGGNKTRAAAMLGIARSTLERKLAREVSH